MVADLADAGISNDTRFAPELRTRRAVPGRHAFRVSFSIPAAPTVAPSVNPADIKNLIAQGLPAEEISVTSDDGTHFEALVVSSRFEGQRPVARHQLVYATLGARMGREIHALSLRTLTPDEWRRQRGGSAHS